ncbi:MAG: hypothetical protein EA403_00280 [Spirochaetaceae bacterium]|nr:MAG: hypothetical protein EA403_00280 [Spirochaetaceae bacterium]
MTESFVSGSELRPDTVSRRGDALGTEVPARASGDVAALLVVALVLLLAIPLLNGLQSGNALTGELLEVRSRWTQLTFQQFGELLAHDATVLPPADGLGEMQTISRVSRFAPDLRAELDQLTVMLNQPVPANEMADAASDIEMQFLRVYELLRDLESRRDYAYGSLLVFLLIFVLGLVIVHRVHWERLRRLVALRQHEQRIARLAGAVRDQERHRIARELHDEAAQNLALAAMIAEQLSPDEPNTRLRSALRRAIADIRGACDRLRPPAQWNRDPVAMLTALRDTLQDRYPIQIRIDGRSPEGVSWDDDDTLNVYRIVQEALMNSIRHAGVESALVMVSGSANRVQIAVTDAGCGIGSATEGRGRSGMRERAELLGAELDWFVPEGGGTGVRLQVPRRAEDGR